MSVRRTFLWGSLLVIAALLIVKWCSAESGSQCQTEEGAAVPGKSSLPAHEPFDSRPSSAPRPMAAADATIEAQTDITIDRAYTGSLDRGYDARQEFLAAYDEFSREADLSPEQRRAMLLAIYDYQEQMLALTQKAQDFSTRLLEQEEQRYGTTAKRDDETEEEYGERESRILNQVLAEAYMEVDFVIQLEKELRKALSTALGPEEMRRWMRICGDLGTGCLEDITTSEFDLLSIPGLDHLHECEEHEPCYDQRMVWYWPPPSEPDPGYLRAKAFKERINALRRR